jgi:chromosome segregation ATPase
MAAMNDHLKERLIGITAEIERIRTELGSLEERRSDHRRLLERRRAQMLVAETPLADHEYRLARLDHNRVEARVEELEAELLSLDEERDRMLGLLGTRPPEAQVG